MGSVELFSTLDKAEHIAKQIKTMKGRIAVNQEYIDNPLAFDELKAKAEARIETRKAVVQRLKKRYISLLSNHLNELDNE
jgi:hypothetical protein